jgi:ATP-dependent RNA helicase DeaD
MSTITSFADFGFSSEIFEAVKSKGYEIPSPIQAQAIPLLLSSNTNLVGKAQTGTGKTAAFSLPILEKLGTNNKKVKAIVLTPTRELANQVAEEMVSLKGAKKLRIQTVYGGQSMGKQLDALQRGVDIVIGTPGRIKDHINRGTLKIDDLDFFVLDEADEMLNMGFLEEIEEILEYTNDEKQMLLFSATMPKKILKLISQYMSDYKLIEIESQQQTTQLVDQIHYEIKGSDRFEALCRIIDCSKEFYGIVFCNTKREVDEVNARLNERGIESEALHGDIMQAQRENIMKKLKKHKCNVLVATDVAARGIDVNDLTHVINFELPQDPESYVHRIGRTGRAGKEGIAITFVSKNERSDFMFIQKITNTKIRKGELPTVKDVLEVKKQIIKDKITNIIEHGGYSYYEELAQEILESNDPEVALAAILKQAFKDQLNIDKYQDFVVPQYDERHTGARRDHGNGRSNTSRIFIALGKKDNKGPRDIVDFITQETTLKGGEIDEVRVFDAFSFATIPNEEANILIAMHKKLAKGNKPLVTIAKDRDDERGGGGTRSVGFRRDGGGRSGGGRSGGYGGGGRSGGYGGGGDRNSDGGGTERKRFKR